MALGAVRYIRLISTGSAPRHRVSSTSRISGPASRKVRVQHKTHTAPARAHPLFNGLPLLPVTPLFFFLLLRRRRRRRRIPHPPHIHPTPLHALKPPPHRPQITLCTDQPLDFSLPIPFYPFTLSAAARHTLQPRRSRRERHRLVWPGIADILEMEWGGDVEVVELCS